MTQISASLVKILRERTNAPMMDCKKALTETNGDIEAAIDLMRKTGAIKAAKKEGRETSEGHIAFLVSEDHKRAVLIVVNCETDFVARTDDFKDFTQTLAAVALKDQINSIEALMTVILSDGQPVDKMRTSLVAKLGENINVSQLIFWESSHYLDGYIHAGRIGVLLELDQSEASLAKDIAMHIAATAPEVIAEEDFPTELLEKEKAIYLAQVADSGKPAEIVEKMLQGRLQKFMKEVSLYGQNFIKNPDETVKAVLAKKQATVQRFARFSLGQTPIVSVRSTQ